MKWKIEVRYKSGTPDVAGEGIQQDVADLGVAGVKSARTAQIYWMDGALDAEAIQRICRELLADPVTQDYTYRESDQADAAPLSADASTIEVRLKPGVTDAVGDSVVKGVRDLGIPGVRSTRTGKKYWLRGALDGSTLRTIAQRLLVNDVIQSYEIRDA